MQLFVNIIISVLCPEPGIEESSILDYLRTKYDAPEENTVQADLTEFVFDIQDRKVHFWRRDSTSEILGVGGVQALRLICPTPRLVAVFVRRRTATITLLGILTRGVAGAIAAATAEAFIGGVSLTRELCSLCAPTCACLPIPSITAGPTVTVRTR